MSAAVALPPTYTPEDLLTLPDGGKGYELVDGCLVEKNMGGFASAVASEINCLLVVHGKRTGLGWVLDSEGSYQCFADAPTKVRKPDVSFIRRGRLPDERIPDGHVLIAPDLAVEVVSPNDTAYEVNHKVQEYRNAGIPWIWVVYPETQTVFVFGADGFVRQLGERDDLTLPDLIPDLRCKVGELFTNSVPR